MEALLDNISEGKFGEEEMEGNQCVKLMYVMSNADTPDMGHVPAFSYSILFSPAASGFVPLLLPRSLTDPLYQILVLVKSRWMKEEMQK